MFTSPGLIALVVYIFVRPFAFVPELRGIPFLYIFFGLAVLGFLLDLGQHNLRWSAGPHLPWVCALVVWAAFTLLIRAPSSLGSAYDSLLIAPSLYFLIAHGTATFRSFAQMAGAFLVCTLVVAAICVHQGLQPYQCLAFQPGERPGENYGTPEGRGCTDVADCYEGGDPELTYRCERVGLGGISSIYGRVRYVGVLQDPNEAALTVSLGVPFAIARYQRRRSLPRLIVLCLALVLACATVIMSQSRGGQLVFLAVLTVYFLGRYRWKGLLAALPIALPVLLYGGRSDAAADSSTLSRLGCALAGIKMFRAHPLLGVGHGQFLEHHGQTAHNSYVLAPAELGLFGMTVWAMMLWVSFKVCFDAVRGRTANEEARTWGFALFSALTGVAVGVLFLTFNYHFVLWILFGLAGAYYQNVRREHHEHTVRVGLKDVLLVAGLNLALLVLLLAYIRMKGVTS